MSKRWDYEAGLKLLDERLTDPTARRSFEEIAETLRQSLRGKTIFGQTRPAELEQCRQSVLALNRLALAQLNTPFNALCLRDAGRSLHAGLDYEGGLAKLWALIPTDDSQAVEAYWELEHLLWVNLGEEMYGSSETNRRERYQLVDALNRLALKYADCSFNDMCAWAPHKSTGD